MSEENVEVVRRVNEAFDAKSVKAILAEYHPDAEIVVLRSEIMGPYRGHEGLRRMAEEIFSTVPDYEVRIDEVRDCGSRVLVLGRQRGTVGGVPFDRLLAEVFEIDEGKVAWSQAFSTVDQALEAAGLPE